VPPSPDADDSPGAGGVSGAAGRSRRAAEESRPARAASGSDGVRSLPLTSEQREVMRAIATGTSVFFTGAAGCGKSVLLRRIVGALPPGTTAVTAPTGVAACNVGGTTVHAFAGVGRPDVPAAEMASVVRRRPEALSRWRRTRVLVVDEISMLDGDALDALEELARLVRGDPRPFGGIQLVLTGDFLQLPPVAKGSSRKPYAFEARCWGRCVGAEVELTRVFRQADGAFVRALNAARWGVVTDEAREALSARWGASVRIGADGHGPAIRPTLLSTHRADVDAVNARELESLPGADVVLAADDTAPSDAARRALEAGCPAPARLRLRAGAQVMLVRNLDVAAGLVNGARGVVVSFSGTLRYPRVRFASGAETLMGREAFPVVLPSGVRAVRKQVPLRLAFAISVHKSQGTSLDAVSMSLSRVFEAGQAYVALSRARSLEGLSLVDKFDPACVRACPIAVGFHADLRVKQGRAVPPEAAEALRRHREAGAAAGPTRAAPQPAATAGPAGPPLVARAPSDASTATAATVPLPAQTARPSDYGAARPAAAAAAAVPSSPARRARRRCASDRSPDLASPTSCGKGSRKAGRAGPSPARTALGEVTSSANAVRRELAFGAADA